MTDELPEHSKQRISITDEFSEFSLLHADAEDADRDRIIGAVMRRIRGAHEPPDADSLMVAIGNTAKPAMAWGVLAAAAALALLARLQSPDRAVPEIPAPSTAQALGLPVGVARWTEQRDHAPQLLEVARDLSEDRWNRLSNSAPNHRADGSVREQR